MSFRRKAEEEERLRIERERQEAKELIKRLYDEYFLRQEQLKVSFKLLAENEKQLQTVLDERTKLAQWDRYMRCDGLPDPTDLPQLNAYISTWAEDEDPDSLEINRILQKCAQVLKVHQ
jgi:cancer susceptibility candidate protein 1